LQAKTHFIAKRPAIHENDAIKAIFEHACTTSSRGTKTGAAFTGYNLRFCLRNTVFRSLNEWKSHQAFAAPEMLVLGFFLFFG
jgi:hypothetical protein